MVAGVHHLLAEGQNQAEAAGEHPFPSQVADRNQEEAEAYPQAYPCQVVHQNLAEAGAYPYQAGAYQAYPSALASQT